MFSSVEAKYVRYMSSFSGREVRILRVGKSLAAPFRQIADAIRASRPYDRIEVESGKYFEALFINHALEFCSAGDGEPPVIKSRGPCLTIKADGPVLVDSIVIIAKGTRASDSQSIVIHSGKPVIQNCDLSSVYVMNDAAPQITHCRICNSNYGCGIAIMGSSEGVYSNNYISDHNEESIHIATSGRPTIDHNRITQKPGTSGTVVSISGRLLKSCEPLFHDNIIRGTTVANEHLDSYAAHSPEMLVEENPRELPCLVRVSSGATPRLFGNLLSNGIMGFFFARCALPPDHFTGNRVLNCVAWGIAVAGGVSLAVLGNDVRYCGGGIRVSSASTLVSDNEKENGTPRVSLAKCNIQHNYHYGILIDHSSVSVSECNVVKSSVGMAFIGNSSASRILSNTFLENTTAAFSIMRRGVVTLEANTVRCSTGESMYGVLVMDSSTVTLRTNLITGMGTSIFVRNGSRLVAEKNILNDTSVHHVVLVEGSHGTINENTIQCSSCAAVVVTEGSHGSVHNNVMYSCVKEGVLVEHKSKLTIKGNGMSSMGDGIYIRHGAHAIVEDNDISQSQAGIVVEGKESTCMLQSNRFRGIRSIVAHAFACAELTARENTVVDRCTVGFQVASQATALLERNTLQRCSEGAVCVDGPEAHCRVLDCNIEDVGYGILCKGRAHSTITGNTLHRCAVFGVKCDSDGETLVRNNSIHGSGVGIILAACGEVCENTTDDCDVGIAALSSARAALRDHRTLRCGIGLRIEAATRVSVERVVIRRSREAGVSVSGPAPAVTVRDCSVEHSAATGVTVRAGGACRFERCVVRDGPGAGICLDSRAGAAVFDDCAVVDHACGIVSGGQAETEGAKAKSETEGAKTKSETETKGAKAETETKAKAKAKVAETERVEAQAESESESKAKAKAKAAEADKAEAKTETETETESKKKANAAGSRAGPRLERCTVEGAACTAGVVGTAGGTAELRLCRIRASTGVGVALFADARLHFMRCDIADCARAGIAAEAQSAATVEESTIERCETGVRFTAASDWCGDAEGPGTALRRVTVRDCSRAGVLCEPRSAGAVRASIVENCGDGAVLESACRAVIEDTAVRASRACGVRVTGATATGTALRRLVVSDSAAAGVSVEASAHTDAPDNDNDEEDDKCGDKMEESAVCVEASEIFNNAGGGVVFAATGCLDSCVVARNGGIGVLCCGRARPQLRACRLAAGAESNLYVCDTALPSLCGCTVEDAAAGMRVGPGAALRIAGCIARRLETALHIAAAARGASTLDNCAFEDCGVAVEAAASIAMQQCVMRKCGVRIACGAKLEMRACTIDEASDAVVLEAGAAVTVTACMFEGNIRALTATAATLDVRGSTFAQQVHYAIRVQDGEGAGIVDICDNRFSGSAQQSIMLVAAPGKAANVKIVEEKEEEEEEVREEKEEEKEEEKLGEGGMVVTVSGNTFQNDVCSVLVHEAVLVSMYNNTFRECRTGLFLRNTATNTRILSNMFEGNECGCLCEENATAEIWRNTFCKNTKNGLLVKSGSKPLVVANVFIEHPADAISFRDGGGGSQLAMNEISRNNCGVRLQDSRDTALVSNNTFEANSISIQLDQGASAHVIACVFLSSTSADVSAIGALSPAGCVLAYNCFASPDAVGVDLADEAELLLFRSVLLGEEATGTRFGSRTRGVVSECLFFNLRNGVIAAECAAGHVEQCIFVYCTSAVEAQAHSTTEFQSCSFLARHGSKRLSSIPPMIKVCAEAEPTFLNCSFLSRVAEAGVLVDSFGGGCVKDSVFSAVARGKAVVVLEDHCTMALYQNTFLGGNIGVVMNPSSDATVEANVFHGHHIAAVELANNAKGKLSGNTFAQQLNEGAILAGAHSTAVDANRMGGVGERKALNQTDAAGLAERFGDWLAEAPQWARQAVGSSPAAAVLPAALIARLNAEAEPKSGDLNGELRGAEEDEKPQESREKAQEKGTQRQAKPRGEKKRKKLRKSVSKETTSFALSDALVEAPRNLDNILLAWVEDSGVVLTYAGASPLPLPVSPPSLPPPRAAPEEIGVTAEQQNIAEEDPLRGDGAAALETEIRGTSIAVRPSDPSRRNSRGSSGAQSASTGPKAVDPREPAHATPATHTQTQTQTVKPAHESICPRAAANARSQAVNPLSRRPRRAIPPPLCSANERAEPQRRPVRGSIATFTACLRKYRSQAGPSHVRKRKHRADSAEAKAGIRAPKRSMRRIAESSLGSLVGSEGMGEIEEEADDVLTGGSRSTVADNELRAYRSDRTSDKASVQRSVDKESLFSLSTRTLSTAAVSPGGVQNTQIIFPNPEVSLGAGNDKSDADSKNTLPLPFASLRAQSRTTTHTSIDTGASQLLESGPETSFKTTKSSEKDINSMSAARLDAKALEAGLVVDAETSDMGPCAVQGSTSTPVNDALPDSKKISAKRLPKVAQPPGKGRALRQGSDGKREEGARQEGERITSVSSGKKVRRGKKTPTGSNIIDRGTAQETGSDSQSLLGKAQGSEGTDEIGVHKKGMKEGNAEPSKLSPSHSSTAVHARHVEKGDMHSPKSITKSSGTPSHESTAAHDVSVAAGRVSHTSSGHTLSVSQAHDDVVKLLKEDSTTKQGEGKQYDQRGNFSSSGDSKDAEATPQRSARITTILERPVSRAGAESPRRKARARTSVPRTSAGKSSGHFETNLGVVGDESTTTTHMDKFGAESHAATQVRADDVHSVSERNGIYETDESRRVSGENISSTSQAVSTTTSPRRGVMSTSSSTLPQLTASSLHSIKSACAGVVSPRIQKMFEEVEGIVYSDSMVSTGPSSRRSPSCQSNEINVPVSTSSQATVKEPVEIAEVEDIIALLRWLADMRAQRLLSEARFQEAVSSMQTNTRVPFYIDDADGIPTVMVRLPQAPGETVAVPLMNSHMGSHLYLEDDTQASENIDLRPSSHLAALPVLHSPLLRSDASQSTADARRAPLFNRLPLLSANRKPPRAHFAENAEVPPVFGAIGCTRLLVDRSATDDAVMRDTQTSRAESRRVSTAHARAPTRAVAFNPARPMETSPYVKNTRVSTFIAAGTLKMAI